MVTRRYNRRHKRKTIRKQRGGYTPYMILKERRTISKFILFDKEFDDSDTSLDFNIDFNSFCSDANLYFSKDSKQNPIYASNLDTIIDGIKEICTRYSKYLDLQNFPAVTPGDILYYHPNSTYKAGHIETVLGTITLNYDKDFLIISRTHPSSYGFSAYTTKINLKEEDTSIHILRYSGPKASLIRATTAFLSKIFLENSLIDYSIWDTVTKIGSKLLTGKRCIETNLEEIKRRVDKTKEKLFTHEKLSTVCSGFSILMCELAFKIHDMDLELVKDMPFDAKACLPTDFYTKIQELAMQSTDWKNLPFYKQVKGLEIMEEENPHSILSLLNVKLDVETNTY